MNAQPTNWKTEPMPNETDSLNFQRTFSFGEFERLKVGIIPKAMEHRWFVYYHEHTLNFHRS